MTKEKILKQLETAKGIYGYMYGRQYYRVAVGKGEWNTYADRLLFIEKEALQIGVGQSNEDCLFYRWGYPGPDYNLYYFKDYGKTWVFTKDDLEPNPYPREEGVDYDS